MGSGGTRALWPANPAIHVKLSLINLSLLKQERLLNAVSSSMQVSHKSINNTLVYMQMVQFKNEEYLSATATSIEESKRLIESGFEYVTELDGVKLFRKRK